MGRLTPVNVPIPLGKNVTDVAGGRAHTIAMTGVCYTPISVHSNYHLGDDMIYAWGTNRQGQLGDGSTIERRTPTAVDFSELSSRTNILIKVVAGRHFSLALTRRGQLITWGGNEFGQLGDGTVQSALLPKYMPRTNGLSGRSFVDVVAGYDHVIVMTGTK